MTTTSWNDASSSSPSCASGPSRPRRPAAAGGEHRGAPASRIVQDDAEHPQRRARPRHARPPRRDLDPGPRLRSTAWVAGVVHAHSWLLSHFPARVRTTSTAPIPTRWCRRSSGRAARRRAQPTGTGSKACGRSRPARTCRLAAARSSRGRRRQARGRRGRFHRPDLGRHVHGRLVRQRASRRPGRAR